MRAFCLLWQNFGKWIQASRYGFVFIKKWIDSRINSRLDADNTFAGFLFCQVERKPVPQSPEITCSYAYFLTVSMRLLSPSVNPLEYGWFHRLHHWALPQSCGP